MQSRRRPRILLDVDGVVANWIDAALPYIRTLTGIDHQYDDVVRPMIEEALGMTPEQSRSFYEIVSTRGWCAAMPLYDGVAEGIQQLAKSADIYPVTKQFPSDFWVREREAWLLDRLGIPGKHVVHTDSKFLVRGDVFIEDRPENLMNWSTEFPDGIAVLYDQPYNRHDWGGLRVTGWKGAGGVVETVSWWMRYRKLVD